jgi:hypothetical protein
MGSNTAWLLHAGDRRLVKVALALPSEVLVAPCLASITGLLLHEACLLAFG